MSIIETIINKALSFEGVAENPAGSNNVQFNTHYYGREVHDGDTGPNAAYPWCVTFLWDFKVVDVNGKEGMFSDYVGPPTFSVMGKKLRQRYTFMTIIIMGGYFPQDRLVTLY